MGCYNKVIKEPPFLSDNDAVYWVIPYPASFITLGI